MDKTEIIKYPKVIFRDSDHSYWLGDGPIDDPSRRKLTSVNTMWGRYCLPFNEEVSLAFQAVANLHGKSVWRKYFAARDKYDTLESFKQLMSAYINEEFWREYESSKLQWELNRFYGSRVHSQLEEEAYKKGIYVHPITKIEYPVVSKDRSKYDNYSVVDDLWELEDGVHLELVVFDEESMSCGQVDVAIIETVDGVRYYQSIDFKTNGGENIEKGKKKRKDIAKYDKKNNMSPPFDHLYDCTKTKYQAQLSLYARIMEKAGYIVDDLYVAHMLLYNPESLNMIHMPYLSKESKMLLG